MWPSGAQNGPKTPKSGFFQFWGPFWAKRPPTKFDRMVNAAPVSPVWGPMCPWGPANGRFFWGLGAILSVGDRFCRLGTQPTKIRFGRNSAPPGSFGNVLAHRNRICVAQLSYSDNAGGFHPSFPGDSRFTGFWRGLGTWRNSGPKLTKRISPKKIQKKIVFSSKTELFLFRFRPLVPPIGAVLTEKTKPF